MGERVADFVEIRLDDDTTVLFQEAGTNLVTDYGGAQDKTTLDAALARLSGAAEAAQKMCAEFQEMAAPDEISLEFSLGLSGQVGWFFANSSVEGCVKATLTWTKKPAGNHSAQ